MSGYTTVECFFQRQNFHTSTQRTDLSPLDVLAGLDIAQGVPLNKCGEVWTSGSCLVICSASRLDTRGGLLPLDTRRPTATSFICTEWGERRPPAYYLSPIPGSGDIPCPTVVLQLVLPYSPSVA